MQAIGVRHVPWTCRWATFGGRVEIDAPVNRVADIFWTCRHPILGVRPRLLARDECERCPYWEAPQSPAADDPRA